MRIHNLYVDDDGETHFRDIEVEWKNQGRGGRTSATFPATGIIFRETPGANGGPKLHTIDLTGRNEQRVNTQAFASDPAWSPLLPPSEAVFPYASSTCRACPRSWLPLVVPASSTSWKPSL